MTDFSVENPKFDVLVVGAGLVGSSFALALGATGLTVALVEPYPPAPVPEDRGWDSRVYAVSPGNAAWLAQLGVWEALPQDRLTHIEHMHVFGDRGGARLEFSAYEAGLRELAWIAENRLLQAALWGALQASAHVTLVHGQRPAELSWEQRFALLSLEDGSEITASLVVAADGADSWVRERSGITCAVYDYRETGVVANFSSARRHGAAAYQWFRSDGVLALLPLPGDRVSMVWSAPERHAQALLRMPATQLAREVEAASSGALGALAMITAPAAFPLRRQRVERLVQPRLALIGDAAHNVHPLAGQGVNLGFRDARELAAVLASRGPQHDCGNYDLLRRYERARREDITALELTTDGLEKLFSSRRVFLAGLRNIGLSLLDRQLPLKNALIRHAAA
ncbi:MAG TPA: UbiH/UbiF family hydroxylase [Burkholderiales bacterium]|nr:UbiH/UbiF family hydroxylase [Burkholderiales bacterium]